jgi:hypothetical protein
LHKEFKLDKKWALDLLEILNEEKQK